jgi:hypothetical protein
MSVSRKEALHGADKKNGRVSIPMSYNLEINLYPCRFEFFVSSMEYIQYTFFAHGISDAGTMTPSSDRHFNPSAYQPATCLF